MEKSKLKKAFILFVICFLLVLFIVFNILPYFWAKTSLTANVMPQSAARGTQVQFSGTLTGEDHSGKDVVVEVTCPDSTLVATLTVTTDATGFWHDQWTVPSDNDLGKMTVTASYETLHDSDNFIVKFAAPQKYGRNIGVKKI